MKSCMDSERLHKSVDQSTQKSTLEENIQSLEDENHKLQIKTIAFQKQKCNKKHYDQAESQRHKDEVIKLKETISELRKKSSSRKEIMGRLYDLMQQKETEIENAKIFMTNICQMMEQKFKDMLENTVIKIDTKETIITKIQTKFSLISQFYQKIHNTPKELDLSLSELDYKQHKLEQLILSNTHPNEIEELNNILYFLKQERLLLESYNSLTQGSSPQNESINGYKSAKQINYFIDEKINIKHQNSILKVKTPTMTPGSKVEDQHKEIEDLHNSIVQLKEQSQIILVDKIDTLNNEIKYLQDQLKDVQDRLIQANELQSSELHDNLIIGLECKLRETTDTHNLDQIQISLLQTQIESQKQQIASITSEKNENINNLKEQLSINDEVISQLQEQISDVVHYKQYIIEFNDLISKKDETLNQQQMLIEDMQRKYRVLIQCAYDTQSSKSTEIIMIMDKIKSKFNEIQTTIKSVSLCEEDVGTQFHQEWSELTSDLQNQMSQLQEDFEIVQAEYANVNQSMNTVIQQINLSQCCQLKNNASLPDIIEAIKQMNDQKIRSEDELQKQISNLVSQVEYLCTHRLEIQQQIQDLQNQVNLCMNEIDSLQQLNQQFIIDQELDKEVSDLKEALQSQIKNDQKECQSISELEIHNLGTNQLQLQNEIVDELVDTNLQSDAINGELVDGQSDAKFEYLKSLVDKLLHAITKEELDGNIMIFEDTQEKENLMSRIRKMFDYPKLQDIVV